MTTSGLPAGPPPRDGEKGQGDRTERVSLDRRTLGLTGLGLTVPDSAYEGETVLLSVQECAWLANLPVKDEPGLGVLGRAEAGKVYRALIDAGHAELIPTVLGYDR